MDWYSASVGAIGQAFGPSARAFTPPTAFAPAVDERAFAAQPAFDARSFTLGGGPGASFWRGIEDPISRFEQQAAREMAAFEQQYGGGVAPGAGGPTGQLAGDASVLNQYDAAFQQAAAKYGFDPNWLKAIAATERGWEGESIAGAQGLMQIMPGGYPTLEAQYPNWQTDPFQNIMLGAAILQDKVRGQGGDLHRGTMAYLGLGPADGYGTTPDAYLGRVNDYYGQLQQSGGSFGGATGSGNILGMFGQGASVEDWGEFGVDSGNGLYDYGTSYGLNGRQHTGLDVMMPVGTAFYAPVGGTVKCAGTGIGQGADGGGCSAFNDYYGSGAGRVEVLLDNGVVLIFGHASTSALQAGMRFNAGALLGTSGGMNSPHIHLEARVKDPSMPSGYRIVDPRTVLGGGAFVGGGSAAVPNPTANFGFDWFRNTPEVLFGPR